MTNQGASSDAPFFMEKTVARQKNKPQDKEPVDPTTVNHAEPDPVLQIPEEAEEHKAEPEAVGEPVATLEPDTDTIVRCRCVTTLRPWANGQPMENDAEYTVSFKEALALEANGFVKIL